VKDQLSNWPSFFCREVLFRFPEKWYIPFMEKVPVYIFFSLLAALGFALNGLIQKFTSKHRISDPWTLLFYSYVTYVPFLLFYPIIFNIRFPSSELIFIFLYALMFTLGNIFFMNAIYKIDASTFAPFFQLQSAFVAVLAFVFLGERFPAQNYLLIFLMIVGSILVTIDEKMSIKTYFKIGIALIVLQQIFHAASNIFAGFALRSMDSFTFIFWGDLLGSIMVVLIALLLGKIRLRVSFSQIKPLIFSGFFSLIGATALFIAFKTNVTISSAISLLTSPIVLITTIVSSKFKPELLEHHPKNVYLIRGSGVLLILIATIKLSMGV